MSSLTIMLGEARPKGLWEETVDLFGWATVWALTALFFLIPLFAIGGSIAAIIHWLSVNAPLS